MLRAIISKRLRNAYAPIAQLDRVTDYESVGRGFESLSAYQKSRYPFGCLDFCFTERDSKIEIQQPGGLLGDGQGPIASLMFRVPFGVVKFRCVNGLELFNANVRWTFACRRSRRRQLINLPSPFRRTVSLWNHGNNGSIGIFSFFRIASKVYI